MLESNLRSRLREVDGRLSGIGTIALQASLFRRIQLHRNNGFYAFLLRICELVLLSLLADRTGDNPSWFRDLLSDETYMAAVFEEFIRNFYSLKQSHFSVSRTQPKWNASATKPTKGGPPIKEFRMPGFLGHVRWAPKGDALQYLQTQDGATNLWEQPLEGGEPRQTDSF